MTRLLTAEQVAERLAISPSRVRAMARGDTYLWQGHRHCRACQRLRQASPTEPALRRAAAALQEAIG